MVLIECTSTQCDESCEAEEDFLTHLKSSHKNDHDFKCHKCFKSFGYVCRLRRHFKSCKSSTTGILLKLNSIDENTEIKNDYNVDCSSDSTSYHSPISNKNNTNSYIHNISEDLASTSINEGNINAVEEFTNPVEEFIFNPMLLTTGFRLDINPTEGMFEIVLKLLGNMSITKNIAFEVFNDVISKIVRPILNQIKTKDPCKFEDLELCINKFIDTHGTEYKFRNILKQNQLYFPAEKFKILRRHNIGRVTKSHGYIFPIEDNIKTFFRFHDDALKEMLYVNYNNSSISTVLDSKIWKEKVDGFEGSYVIPLTVYSDDIEINNPIGSKRGVEKISTVYISFPLLGKLIALLILYYIILM